MKVTVIKKDESVIYNGVIYRNGESFDADDLIGQSLVERGYVTTAIPEVTPAIPDDEGEAEDNSANVSLQEASYTELKKLAASMGLPANGKKNDLIARITAAQEAADTEVTDEADEEIPDDLPNTDMPE